jgi:cytochrome c-type biogenesis protein CcmH
MLWRGARPSLAQSRIGQTPMIKPKNSLCFVATVLFVSLAATAPVIQAQQTARGKQVAKRVMCMCGGCEDSAGMCSHPGGSFSGPCETARGMQKDIDDRVSKNQTDDEILAAYVTQYGPTVLVEPPKKGFDLLAWVMPVLMPILALILVWYVVRSWRRKATLAPAGGPPVDAQLLMRAQREAGTRDAD